MQNSKDAHQKEFITLINEKLGKKIKELREEQGMLQLHRQERTLCT